MRSVSYNLYSFLKYIWKMQILQKKIYTKFALKRFNRILRFLKRFPRSTVYNLGPATTTIPNISFNKFKKPLQISELKWYHIKVATERFTFFHPIPCQSRIIFDVVNSIKIWSHFLLFSPSNVPFDPAVNTFTYKIFTSCITMSKNLLNRLRTCFKAFKTGAKMLDLVLSFVIHPSKR